MESDTLIELLKNEVDRTMGCTDPGTVSLAVSRARRELGCEPDTIKVTVSPGLYKNAACVGVPGTGQTGLYIAVALGAVIDNYEAGLAILDSVNDEKLHEAQELLHWGTVTIDWEPMKEVLYVYAEVQKGEEKAHAIIQGDYSHIVEAGKNGVILEQQPFLKDEGWNDPLNGERLFDVIRSIREMTAERLLFMLRYAEVNRDAFLLGSEKKALRLAVSLKERGTKLPEPFGAMAKAQLWTGTAGEARMAGIKVPIMALAGSGNQGITSFLGVLAVAEELESEPGETARALAISSIITIYMKSTMARLSTVCGCTSAAAPGVAAGTVYLLGGTDEQMEQAMQTVIGTLAGMICDGAKESCAYKLSMVVNYAIQAAYMAMNGTYIRSGAGIIAGSIEQTITNVGRLNRAMEPVNLEILKMISESQKT